jgi:predicted nucleic acid-binding protein
VEALVSAMRGGQARMPPAVLSELLSDPGLPSPIASRLKRIPLLPVSDGYRERAGRLRAALLAARRKAHLADALIAQSCLDHRVPLVTRDGDFRHFRRFGLELLPLLQ